MPLPGELQAPMAAQDNSKQPKRTSKLLASRPHVVDSSGADLEVIDGYLQQLLPALAGALDGAADPDDAQTGLTNLGLDRAALLARSVPQHSINALYRSMAAHADAFKKLVAGEVQQLKQLLSQQAGPQLQSTIQLLDGPIASTAAQQTLTSGRAHAMKQSLQQQQEKQQRALTATAAESITAAGYGSAAARGLGPSADDLVKDYADAYASMKETMEVRLRHEQRRGDFLQNKLQQTESSLRDTTAQLESANRRVAEQRSELAQLADQIAGLQSDLASSHAAHLALQQHHKETMEQAATERQQMEELHRKTVETLQADLTKAGGAAAALAESSRQVEALRLLYNEELSRASRLAVELSRATAAADRAAAEEDNWRRQLTKSDDRADNAEGMAEAMKATVKQLEEELQQERARLEAKKDEAAKLRLMLERSRLAAVQHRAEAQSTVLGLASKVQEQSDELSAKQSSLHSTEDNLKLRVMEVEGANAQLQASRTHLKQLMSDLETEQEKSTNLGNALAELKQQSDELVAAKEIAEGRLRTVQVQLSKANDSSAMMSEQLNELRATVEERTAELNELQDSLHTERAAHAALQEQADRLKTQVTELQLIEQQYGQLRYQHAEATAKLERLEQEHVDLTAKARQLELTTEELHSLQSDHNSLKSRLSSVEQKLQVTSSNLGEVEDTRHRSEAQVVLLQDKLEHADVEHQRLARELLSVTSAGDSAYHQVEQLSQQLDSAQSALETAEADRQALAAQRDAWMASFQEAYGKLQEWKAANQAASHKLAGRASIIQTAMQHLSSQMTADIEASDGLLAGRTSLIGSRTSVFTGGSNNTSADGSSAAAAAAGSASNSRPASAAAAAAERSGLSGASSVATAEVLDQMSALQQLMQAEAAKHQELYGDALEELSQRVQERSQAAQAWWQEQMAAAQKKKAARAAAAAAKKKHKLAVMAAAQRSSLAGAAGSAVSRPLQVLHHAQQQQYQHLQAVAETLESPAGNVFADPAAAVSRPLQVLHQAHQQQYQHLQPVAETVQRPAHGILADAAAAATDLAGWDLDMQPVYASVGGQLFGQQSQQQYPAVEHPGTAVEAGQARDNSNAVAGASAGTAQAADMETRYDEHQMGSESPVVAAAAAAGADDKSDANVVQAGQHTAAAHVNLVQAVAAHGQQRPVAAADQQQQLQGLQKLQHQQPNGQQQLQSKQQQQQQLPPAYQQLLQQHQLLQQQHHLLLQRIQAQQQQQALPQRQQQPQQHHSHIPEQQLYQGQGPQQQMQQPYASAQQQQRQQAARQQQSQTHLQAPVPLREQQQGQGHWQAAEDSQQLQEVQPIQQQQQQQWQGEVHARVQQDLQQMQDGQPLHWQQQQDSTMQPVLPPQQMQGGVQLQSHQMSQQTQSMGVQPVQQQQQPPREGQSQAPQEPQQMQQQGVQPVQQQQQPAVPALPQYQQQLQSGSATEVLPADSSGPTTLAQTSAAPAAAAGQMSTAAPPAAETPVTTASAVDTSAVAVAAPFSAATAAGDMPAAGQLAAPALQAGSSSEHFSQQLVTSTTTTTTTTTVTRVTSQRSSSSGSNSAGSSGTTAGGAPAVSSDMPYAAALAASSSNIQQAVYAAGSSSAQTLSAAVKAVPTAQPNAGHLAAAAAAAAPYSGSFSSQPGSPRRHVTAAQAGGVPPDTRSWLPLDSSPSQLQQQQQQGLLQHAPGAAAAPPTSHGLYADHSQGFLGQQQGQSQPYQGSARSAGLANPSQGLFLDHSQGTLEQQQGFVQPYQGSAQPTSLLTPSQGLFLDHSHDILGQQQGSAQPAGLANQSQGLFLDHSQGIVEQQQGSTHPTSLQNPSLGLLSEHSQGFQQGLLPSFQGSALLLSNPGLDSSSSSKDVSMPGGGFLSGFVSMVAYQDQMKSVAKLHSQVGEMAVQLREAHADAEGAAQQLHQERQGAATRTTALCGALGQLHGQIEELRTEHEALQQAHRQLVAKDLMKSGILKDRYVADLFARLQEAEWKLDVARRRACMWGFEMMVPLGRVDRSIQTQYAEVWAAEQQQQQGAAAAVSPSQASIQRRLQQGAAGSSALTAARPLSGGSSSGRRMHLDPLTDTAAGMSSTVNTAAIGAAGIPVIGSAGSPSADSSGGGSIQRRKPAFAQHGGGINQQQQSPQASGSSSSSKRSSSSSKRPASAEGTAQSSSSITSDGSGTALYAAPQELLSAGDVELLPAPALLQLIASLYSAKAAADATALRSHTPALGLWEFVLRHLQKHSSSSTGKMVDPRSGNSKLAPSKGVGSSEESDVGSAAAAALAQLLGSVQQHASSNKEITQFGQALADSRQQWSMIAQARAGTQASAGACSSNRAVDQPSSSSSAVVIKGTWGEVRLDNNKLLPVLPDLLLLLPGGLPDLVERILLWPGMTALLGWVAQGHFLVGLQEGSLGRILMDVQAPHVHFLLLEAADILGLHPLPRVQILQTAAPFVRLLRVPRAQLPPATTAAKSSTHWQQQQQLANLTWQQDSLLVVSSAALQLLRPPELQAAVAAALVPAVLAGGRNGDEDAPGSSSSNDPQQNPPGLEQLSPSTVPGLCELATLSSLLALQPAYLLSHLPAEMHAMGSALAAALQAADRVVAVAGDRGGLLVSQDLKSSLSALLQTGRGLAGGAAAAVESDADRMSSGSSSNGSAEGLMRDWRNRVHNAVETGNMPSIDQLLPLHESLQQQGGSSGSRSGSSAEAQQLEEDQILLLRVKQLIDWSDSEIYKQVMAAAKPLRRVMPPGRRIPSA